MKDKAGGWAVGIEKILFLKSQMFYCLPYLRLCLVDGLIHVFTLAEEVEVHVVPRAEGLQA